MTAMSTRQMTYRPAELRHAVQAGEVVAVTFRGKPYGYMVPADRWRAMTSNEPCGQDDQEVRSA